MDASTTSAAASCVSAVAAASSAFVAALSARHSHRSARSAEEALQETRRQRRHENVRRELVAVGLLRHEATELIRSLATELRREPARVELRRESLRRTTTMCDPVGPRLEGLMHARAPLESGEVELLYRELTDRADSLRALLAEHPAG